MADLTRIRCLWEMREFGARSPEGHRGFAARCAEGLWPSGTE